MTDALSAIYASQISNNWWNQNVAPLLDAYMRGELSTNKLIEKLNELIEKAPATPGYWSESSRHQTEALLRAVEKLGRFIFVDYFLIKLQNLTPMVSLRSALIRSRDGEIANMKRRAIETLKQLVGQLREFTAELDTYIDILERELNGS